MTDGLLRTSDGELEYRVTPEDAIWLARAAKYEGMNDVDATIWTLAQRFAEIGGPGTSYPTLKSLVLAYSQPVNPIWRRTGSKCRPGGTYYGRDNCSEVRLARRDAAAVDPANETLPRVQAWIRGEVPNPVPRATHFAVPSLVESCIENRSCAEIIHRGDNWYASTANSARWPSDFVTISGVASRPSYGVIAGVVALVGGVIAAGVALGQRARGSRRRRRR